MALARRTCAAVRRRLRGIGSLRSTGASTAVALLRQADSDSSKSAAQIKRKMRFILPCSFLQVEALHILQPQLLPPVCLIIQDMLRLVQNFFHIRALVLRHGVRAVGRFGKERGGAAHSARKNAAALLNFLIGSP